MAALRALEERPVSVVATLTDGSLLASWALAAGADGEEVVLAGAVLKKRRLLGAQTRHLALTDRPRLFYARATGSGEATPRGYLGGANERELSASRASLGFAEKIPPKRSTDTPEDVPEWSLAHSATRGGRVVPAPRVVRDARVLRRARRARPGV